MIRTKILSMSESSSQETISTLGKTILEDDATTDFTIRCDTKNFRVHKAVLCARSEVFRASILTPMQEVLSGEIFVKDVGEKSLASVINYLYTGELELGEDPDIQDLTWAGTKYLLPGFLDLLALHLQTRKEELPGQMIADLLIAANRHGVGVLRKIALDRIRGQGKSGGLQRPGLQEGDGVPRKHFDGCLQRFVKFFLSYFATYYLPQYID